MEETESYFVKVAEELVVQQLKIKDVKELAKHANSWSENVRQLAFHL